MAKKKVVQTNQGEEAAKKAFFAKRDTLRQAEADKAKAEKAKAEAEALANANAAGFDSIEAHAEAEALRAEKSRVEASKAEAEAKAKAFEASKAEKAKADVATASLLAEAPALANANAKEKAEALVPAAGVPSIGTGVQVASRPFCVPAKGSTGAGKAAKASEGLQAFFEARDSEEASLLRASREALVDPIILWGREALACEPVLTKQADGTEAMAEGFKTRTLAVALLQAEGLLPRTEGASYGSMAKVYEGLPPAEAEALRAEDKAVINKRRGQIRRAFEALGILTQDEVAGDPKGPSPLSAYLAKATKEAEAVRDLILKGEAPPAPWSEAEAFAASQQAKALLAALKALQVAYLAQEASAS